MKFNINGEIVEVGGSGTSVIICSRVARVYDEEGNKITHAYMGISSDFDITDESISLVFGKRNRVKAKTESSPNKFNGWHNILNLETYESGGERPSAFTPVFLSTEAKFEDNGISYYEISFAEGKNFSEWRDDENGGQKDSLYNGTTGEELYDVTYEQLLKGVWGVALAKDGVRISSYAVFKCAYDSNGDLQLFN